MHRKRRKWRKKKQSVLSAGASRLRCMRKSTLRTSQADSDCWIVCVFCRKCIHSFRCVYMLKDYPPFQANDFEYLRGRILILLPENDIFKKEDQKRFADLFRKLDAEIRTVPGGHVGFIVQAERYLDLMETFLQRNGIWQFTSANQ